jgi:hypothetical protein
LPFEDRKVKAGNQASFFYIGLEQSLQDSGDLLGKESKPTPIYLLLLAFSDQAAQA